MLEHDECPVGVVVVDRGDADHRRPFDRRDAARLREETLAARRRAMAQELESDHLLADLIERAPGLRVLVPAMEERQAVTTSDELPFLAPSRDRSLHRLRSLHSPH